MKKKVLSVLLAAAMVMSMTACGGSDASSDGGSTASSSTTTTTSSSSSSSTESSGSAAAAVETPGEYVLEDLYIVVDGTLTATVDNGQDAFIEQWEAAVSQKLGHSIKLHINQLDHSDYSGTVSRLLTTGEPGDGSFPDALIMSATMFREYAPTGLLWDQADAYANAEFQSRVTLPSINENMKDSTGALYGFAPTYGNGCVTYVKKAWLDAVGMSIDDIKTYDDYYNMLKAFAEQDPDGNGSAGTYGVIAAGYGKLDEAPFINYMPEFWQDAYPSIYQKDGVWVDGFQEEATQKALQRLADAYAAGLIDPDTEEAGTKQAREKWFSNDQSTSEGVFTYWAGTWLQTLTDNLVKQEVDSEIVMLPPIAEIKNSWGGYLNREAPVWVITDDQNGDSSREQAIFDALIETMLDGDVVQTLWTYGAEDVHWSIHAEEFTTNPGTDKEKAYSYEEGTFHLKQSPNDPNSVWKKNHLDAVLVIAPLTNGYVDTSELAVAGNKFFTENCVDAPQAPASETLSEINNDLVDLKKQLMNQVVTGEKTPADAIAEYQDAFGDQIETVLSELNG
ncbi:MAG: ABC transporter substrate-binding protein [Lachnospiraceae bacterium]|nr:ABC transporter substrate-binding protein [Lachnospiraceae bacterium]